MVVMHKIREVFEIWFSRAESRFFENWMQHAHFSHFKTSQAFDTKLWQACSQYTRYLAYGDALKNSFFPRTFPLWNSLPSSVVSSKTTEDLVIFMTGPDLRYVA